MGLEEAVNICNDFCNYKDLVVFNINDLAIYQEAIKIVLQELDNKKSIEELYAEIIYKKVNSDILSEFLKDLEDK